MNRVADYIAPSSWPCDAGGSTSHNYDSKEWVSTTWFEAAASFYGAAAFNNMAQTDCRFGVIDCENGQTNFPLAFMENICPTPFNGNGVEIDWLRQLWDVRTNGPSRPTTNAMLYWMNGTGPGLTRDNGYVKLDAAADALGGSVNTNWDAEKFNNGVDH